MRHGKLEDYTHDEPATVKIYVCVSEDDRIIDVSLDFQVCIFILNSEMY